MFLSDVKNIEIFWLIPIPILYIIGLFISSLKWNYNLKYYDLKINNHLNTYWIGSFFSNFLPSSFGGDGYRFYKINKKYPSLKKENFSSIFLERISGLFSIALINIALFPFFLNKLIENKAIFSLSLLIFGVSIVIILVCIFGKYIHKLIPITIIRKKIERVTNTFKAFPKKLFVLNIFLSFIFYLCILVSINLYFLSAGIEITKINIFLLMYLISIINIFGIFPISLNGIGISESLQILLYSTILGISPDLILVTALLGRFGNIIMSSIGGLFYLKN